MRRRPLSPRFEITWWRFRALTSTSDPATERREYQRRCLRPTVYLECSPSPLPFFFLPPASYSGHQRERQKVGGDATTGVAHGRFFQQPRKIAARDRRGRGLSLTPVRAAAAAPAGGPGACAPRQCFCRSAACAWGTLMLPYRAHHRAQKIAVLSHHRFDLAYCPVTVLSGHSQAMRSALAARRG